MKFEIAEEVFELLPDLCFGVVGVEGIDNSQPQPGINELLAENVKECSAAFEGVKAKNAPEIQPYREAFRSIGINPNRYQCSIEALLDRISKGRGMPQINPIVDLGNAVSLKYRIPIGAHDLGTILDSLEVRFVRDGDVFIPFGGGDTETPESGEVVYVSGGQVRTRRWTWRQSEIGKITAETSGVLFPIDGFTDFNKEQVIAARDELAGDIEKYFGIEAEVGLLDRSNRIFEGK